VDTLKDIPMGQTLILALYHYPAAPTFGLTNQRTKLLARILLRGIEQDDIILFNNEGNTVKNLADFVDAIGSHEEEIGESDRIVLPPRYIPVNEIHSPPCQGAVKRCHCY